MVSTQNLKERKYLAQVEIDDERLKVYGHKNGIYSFTFKSTHRAGSRGNNQDFGKAVGKWIIRKYQNGELTHEDIVEFSKNPSCFKMYSVPLLVAGRYMQRLSWESEKLY